MRPAESPTRQAPPPSLRRYGFAIGTWVAWMILMGFIGSQLRQIFQPLGMDFVAFMFFGGLVGVGTVLIFMLFSPRQYCPECQGLLPRFRKPVSLDQALWGGMECPHCHAHVGGVGRKLRALRGKH